MDKAKWIGKDFFYKGQPHKIGDVQSLLPCLQEGENGETLLVPTYKVKLKPQTGRAFWLKHVLLPEEA